MQTSVIFPMCNVDVEHVHNVFIECQYSRRCWDCLDRDNDILEVQFLSTWVLDKLKTETEDRLVKLVKILGNMVR